MLRQTLVIRFFMSSADFFKQYFLLTIRKNVEIMALRINQR